MFQIEVVSKEFESDLQRLASLESEVSNTAMNKGFAYFYAVDQGRGPIVPVNAKALRFIGRDGEVVFSKHAKAAPAQHLLKRSLDSLLANAIISAAQARGNSFLVWARSFLRSIAQREAGALQGVTPRVSGKLARSYKVNVSG